MKIPGKPPNETQRLRALHSLRVLDTPAEERFDQITRMAKRLFDVPIALISLVDSDRQWFKSRQGLDARETPRDISFCGHAILDEAVFVVENAAQDLRFSDNPLVCGAPDIRFYAGCPLHSADGHRIGTLCLIDRVPRTFSASDQALLRDLAALAEQQLRSLSLATTDDLTRIPNRRGFHLLAQQMLATCGRARLSGALLVFDLDNFKRINDLGGHEAGDLALQVFARCLLLTCRESDVLGRIGGDEFYALLCDAHAPDTGAFTDRLRQELAAVNETRHGVPPIAFSVGVAAFGAGAETRDIDTLVAEADARMFAAKSTGRIAVRTSSFTTVSGASNYSPAME
ncbi:MAG: sensor domain-containing diguanylate cyclase [Gammaproteobacteria bacterium]|nr:sensor domain-containing diguanylate cyclase [Gammaproteobacteria bacterium]MDH4311051.1 sensor domain-containing diguanylate cyclase [Gammaproteobacteria bacterium]MDH5274052.1 sensor domain-containing diguanylate cyclase [Gammaproteobacteria bacterium]